MTQHKKKNYNNHNNNNNFQSNLISLKSQEVQSLKSPCPHIGKCSPTRTVLQYNGWVQFVTENSEKFRRLCPWWVDRTAFLQSHSRRWIFFKQTTPMVWWSMSSLFYPKLRSNVTKFFQIAFVELTNAPKKSLKIYDSVQQNCMPTGTHGIIF